MDKPDITHTVEVTTKYGEKKRISERKYLAAMRNLAKAQTASNAGMSRRKRRAIMKNLAKAQRARRTPEGRARSRRNALKHGLFVRHLAGSFLRLGENPRRFRQLHQLFERAFTPRDVIEIRLVKRLAEVVWRHLRTYHAGAVFAEEGIRRRLRRVSVTGALFAIGKDAPFAAQLEADNERAAQIMDGLLAVRASTTGKC